MKTRIISGAVLIALLVGILVLGNFYPVAITIFLSLISAVGVYEMVNNVGKIKNLAVTLGAMIYSIFGIFAFGGYTQKLWLGFTPAFFTIIFVTFIAFASIILHKNFGFKEIAVSIAFPIVITYAFSCVGSLYIIEGGTFYLLLLLNFSSICDCGAYFTGVFLGKHKLAPEISPKKTVEGAVGGIVWSFICSIIFCLSFSRTDILLYVLIATVPLCVVGMCGDLFASVIKRSVEIKDYGNLIPGHGGILDRFDSILLLAPLLNVLVSGGLL